MSTSSRMTMAIHGAIFMMICLILAGTHGRDAFRSAVSKEICLTAIEFGAAGGNRDVRTDGVYMERNRGVAGDGVLVSTRNKEGILEIPIELDASSSLLVKVEWAPITAPPAMPRLCLCAGMGNEARKTVCSVPLVSGERPIDTARFFLVPMELEPSDPVRLRMLLPPHQSFHLHRIQVFGHS